MPGPTCRICGKPYQFPECELEQIMYLRAGAPSGPWGSAPGSDDRAKFEAWTLRQVEDRISKGEEVGELGLNLVLLGRKEGLRALAPLLVGKEQRKWDFMLKRLFPFSFTLTHTLPNGYDNERLQKWMNQNFDRLKWSPDRKAFIVSAG